MNGAEIRIFRMRQLLPWAVAFGCLVLGIRPMSALPLDLPTSAWHAVSYPGEVDADPIGDHQAGQSEGDLVGGTVNGIYHAPFYRWFDGGDAASLTDGTLAFRARLADDSNRPGFNHVLFVGFDANLDGAIDLFAVVNNQGSREEIGLYSAGPGENSSPANTKIGDALVTYTQSVSNFRWEPVTPDNDPAYAHAVGVDGHSLESVESFRRNEHDPIRSGYFLSFSIPFEDLVTQLEQSAGIGGFNETSETGLVLATATQINTINQDINGLNGGIDSETSWTDLGVLSTSVSVNSASSHVTPHVPEPGAFVMLAIGAAVTALRRRRRR